METLSEEILDFFFDLTGIDVRQFFEDFINFIDDNYTDIANYYSGLTTEPNASSFAVLNDINRRYNIIIDLFDVNASRFQDYDGWILLERVEEIGTLLETINNLRRWLRSNATFSGFSTRPQIPYVAKQAESLEDIQQNVASSNEPQDDWVDLALSNDLREEDYTNEGGYLLKVDFQNNELLILNSVVDSIDSVEKSYGLDFDRKLTFEDSDLKVLSPRQTIEQAANILVGLERGDNPAFPNDGLDVRRLIGTSLVGIAYPTIFRQLSNSFAKDDTFRSFSVTNISQQQDAIFINFSIETRAGDVLNRTRTISLS